ncbi:MAG: DUF1292 domain-containing protein [Clostridia bacterium]|nr:DUF1292 domain-containing protein [Clostridia bacterium]
MADSHDYEADLISVLDDEGNEHEFEIIDTIDIDDRHYVALLPLIDPDEDIADDADEAVVFEVVEEDGEEILATIDDDAEFDKVVAIFEERFNDLYEDDEEE